MKKIVLIATLTAAEGKEHELREGIVELINAADEEPGCEIYSAHGSRDEPGVYRFFELYTDSDALKAHGRGERMAAAMAGLNSLMAGPPEVLRLTPLAAKGLDLG
ncbi:MAG: putative quinol monooxygenase [Acidimicrobiales bacterium]